MRRLFAVLSLLPSLVWAASPLGQIEALSAQVSPFWQTLRPACSMALEPKLQMAVAERLSFLDEHLIASELNDSLSAQTKDRSNQWRSPVWAVREKLEKAALQLDDRESLREYFFKLQTQTPNPERSGLVADIQYMSEHLNLALRKELWKTCHALGLSAIPVVQMETAVEQHWLHQEEKVRLQVKRELAAFYFYSFRQTSNEQLQAFVDVAQPLTPWVDATAVAISEHFANLRAQLLQVPLTLTLDAEDEPFLEDRPWPASPSQELLQP